MPRNDEIIGNPDLEREYKERIELLNNKCDDLKKTANFSSKGIPLMYVPQHNFSYCLIGKTGTTTFMRQFKKTLSLKAGFNGGTQDDFLGKLNSFITIQIFRNKKIKK